MVKKSEHNEAVESDVQAVHEGIQRRGHCFRNCVILFLVVMLGLVFGIGYVVAKSGLAEVPLFSGWFSSRPAAVEHVEVPDNQLDALGKRLAKEDIEGQLASGHVRVTLSGADLNALVRLKNPEVSLDLVGDTAIVQVPVKYTGNELIITGTVVPMIDAGKLRLELQKIRVGDLPLPAPLFNALALQFQKNLLDTNPIVQAATFEEVTVGEDHLTIVGSISPEEFRKLEEF